MAKQKDTLDRFSDIVCGDGHLGFSPASNSTKPPHIANGLFRECAGETCNTRDVHSWIISEGRKGAVSSEDIITEFQSILDKGYREKPENIKTLRFLLGEIFNQDNTAYGSYDFSVMTQSSHWMIKGRVSAEGNIGKFLFDILAKEINGQRSPAIEELRRALENDTDDITRLVKPIIAYPSDSSKRSVFGVEYPIDEYIRWDSCKETIRRGFDHLAENLRFIGESKNSLRVLQRYVNFSVFATLLYLSHANAAVYGADRPPFVIDSGCELDSIRKASEQSFTSAKKAVEDYYVNTIQDILSTEEQVENNEAACRRWIDEMTISSKRTDNIREAVASYFDGFLAEKDTPLFALAKALQIALYTFEYKNNSPSDFCRVLGVRCGLVGPKGNRAVNKRFLTNSFTLETIVLSVLSKDELEQGIELKELSDHMIDTYNMLIGADAEREYAILEKANIAQSTPGDLRGDFSENADYLARTLISLGLGKNYADGVTLIGWRL